MSPYQQPGWALDNGHVVRSHTEAAVCDFLTAHKEPHDHGALIFELPLPGERTAFFKPHVSLTQTEFGGRVVLLEPVDSAKPGGGIRRLIAFREWHADRYYVIVLARRSLHAQIPREAHDLLLPIEDFEPLEQFLLSAAGPL